MIYFIMVAKPLIMISFHIGGGAIDYDFILYDGEAVDYDFIPYDGIAVD